MRWPALLGLCALTVGTSGCFTMVPLWPDELPREYTKWERSRITTENGAKIEIAEGEVLIPVVDGRETPNPVLNGRVTSYLAPPVPSLAPQASRARSHFDVGAPILIELRRARMVEVRRFSKGAIAGCVIGGGVLLLGTVFGIYLLTNGIFIPGR